MSTCNDNSEQEFDDHLREVAMEPSRLIGDQGEVSNRSLYELMAYDKHQSQKQPNSARYASMYGTRIKPPSARGY